jgi:hypothetical protein
MGGEKKGWRNRNLENWRRTPVQPESEMRGGTEVIAARREADVPGLERYWGGG